GFGPILIQSTHTTLLASSSLSNREQSSFSPAEEVTLTDELTPPSPPSADGVNGNGGEHYDPLNIADELRDSYLNYAMSVIISRAFPAVRDGLNPSHRGV